MPQDGGIAGDNGFMQRGQADAVTQCFNPQPGSTMSTITLNGVNMTTGLQD